MISRKNTKEKTRIQKNCRNMKEGKIKKKNSVSIPVFNGGGIAGVLVLGGALATAALIAFFARKTSAKKSQSKDSDSFKDSDLKNINHLSDEETENFNQCCESNGISEVGLAQIGQMGLISTKISDLEAFSGPEINEVKETLTTATEDDQSFLPEMMNTEIISLCKDINIDTEELTLQVNKIHDAEEETPLLEAIEELKDDGDVSKIVLVEQLEENVNNDDAPVEKVDFSERVIEEDVEENPSLIPGAEEDSDDVDDEEEEDFDEEESEKSSVETGDSSMESNAEPIWPTETIEKLSLAMKDMNYNYKDSGEKLSKEDGTVEKDSKGNEDESIIVSMVISDNKETDELLAVNYQPVRSGDLRMLLCSILVTLLLLLVLGYVTEHKAMFSYLINGDSV